jgi:predicted NBD/HSP70 family sugar kinase
VHALPPGPVACIEVGGGSTETVVLTESAPLVLPGAVPPPGLPVLLAVPGLIAGDRVLAASNLGWWDVDPAEQLGLDRPASLLLNDAEAAALGESALRDGADLVFVGLGTGVGGAVVCGCAVVGSNLLGHGGSFGELRCRCGLTGCLETVAAGWALPDPLPRDALGAVADAVAQAIKDESLADDLLVVVAGGLARRYPALVDALALALPDRVVEATAAPDEVKSAAAWGLALAYAGTLVGRPAQSERSA